MFSSHIHVKDADPDLTDPEDDEDLDNWSIRWRLGTASKADEGDGNDLQKGQVISVLGKVGKQQEHKEWKQDRRTGMLVVKLNTSEHSPHAAAVNIIIAG